MNRSRLFIIGVAMTVLSPGMPWAADTDQTDLKPFPKQNEGQARHVIKLPQQLNESDVKVELIVGKTMKIDCNHHMFGGVIEERTVDGWGYNYYVLPALGEGASTMKGCPPNSEREAFVRNSRETFVRYNSRLPIVIYTPDDVEVRYRLWRAGRMEKVEEY